jgi:HD-GYP domain-containing protein (c-di-GMP phosphodiesterase class II)
VSVAASPAPAQVQLRLAELVAALSLGIDLGFGQPMEHVLRQCIIALRMGELIGLDPAERSTVYYTSLLVNVGCHSDAHEQAKWFGDDINMKAGKYDYELRSLRGTVASVRMIGSGNPPLQRVRVALDFARSGWRDMDGMITRHAEMAQRLAVDIGLSEEVQRAMGSSYEQWDGHGWPGKLAGADIPIAARLSTLAEYVEVTNRVGGVEAVKELAVHRSGSQFDPELSSLVCDEADAILRELETARTWDAVIDSEPALRVTLTGDRIDQALRAIADFVDLKSPYSLGHADAVSDLAAAAAQHLGHDATAVATMRRAGLVHDLGRLGVSNAIWDKAGPLGAGEWERVRMHPYLTERMLHQSELLAPLGEIAVQHRERLDGSGYPRGLSGGAISEAARVLGAADAYQSMREPRPYRPALTAEEAASELRADVKAGRLSGEAVDAVLASAGHRVPRRREGPAGLTAREIDVLRLLARGLSSKEISVRLYISPKTARNHIEHIYVKIGANSRVTASLFAVQHGLLPEGDGD